MRLTQKRSSQGKYDVRIELFSESDFPKTAEVFFEFNLSNQDQEKFRWYFEDYPLYCYDPAPAIASRVEQSLDEIGIELFNKIFNSYPDARNIWSYVHSQLDNTRIEIATDIQETTSIPWEFIRDPAMIKPLVISVVSFSRIYNQETILSEYEAAIEGPIRILLAICRPDAGDDVPFRSVASRIIKGLSTKASSRLQLEVLRPPTFANLESILKAAKDQNKPYHVLHFDGHGNYIGNRGWIYFEHPDHDEDGELVNGERLGKLLQESNVPILVLNACRSAYLESPSEPVSVQYGNLIDAQSRVKAFGSLAQEVMRSGLAAVIAMRYVVYAVTAAQFMAEFYDALVQGKTIAEAANLGRKHLYDQSVREIDFREHEFRDWSVPVVFGAGNLAVFSRQKGEKKLEIKIRENDVMPNWGYLDPSLPHNPNSGFFGRDGTLLAIDRAFDFHKVVLLHAYAGSGKTVTATEFARWYSLTGGVKGPVLFTSFERYISMHRILDKIGQLFSKILEDQGIHWLTLDEDKKRHVALEVLKQKPVLWIWDNVELVAGFPISTKSDWSMEEQRDLANFLRSAKDTQARFLLTSRRKELEWLGTLPRRVSVPTMSMFESMGLARALANKHSQKMVDVANWKPLLIYAGGNPLTITVLVGQVLREGLITKEQIEMFVDQLRSGEKEIDNDESLGRSRSLGASLRYGFDHAFTESERRILALLSFFQGFVNVNVLISLGQEPFSLGELREQMYEGCIKLLSRAVEVGMLEALDEGDFRIHPALPWFFRQLFEIYYAGREVEAGIAFAETLGGWGSYYKFQYETGHREVIAALELEEANLLFARQIALRSELWDCVINLMQGLDTLYDQTGRWMEWKRFVEEILPLFVDPRTDEPIDGRAKDWNIVAEYRVILAERSHLWDDAIRLQKKIIKWNHDKVKLIKPVERSNPSYSFDIRNYIVSIGRLAEIYSRMGNPKCVAYYLKVINKSERCGLIADAAAYCRDLGNAYRNSKEIRNLDLAERWLIRSIELIDESDELSLGRSLILLGHVAQQRFLDTQRAGNTNAMSRDAALELYQRAQEAFQMLPTDAALEMATTYRAMAVIYSNSGMYAEAATKYMEAISCIDTLGDLYNEATYRFGAAKNLANYGRPTEALEYARSARERFEACGPAAIKNWQESQDLIAKLEKIVKNK